MKYLKWVLWGIDWAEYVFVCILLTAIVVLVSAQVVSRYILQNSLSWSEELNRALFIYLVLVGVSIGVRQGSHMGLHFLTRRLPFVARHALEILMWAAALTLCFIIFQQSLSLVDTQRKFSQTSPATNLPIWWFTLAIPLGMGLTILRIAQRMIILLLDWKPSEAPSAIEEIEREYPEVEIAAHIRQAE